MILKSKTLALVLVTLFFGGILISSAFGWWQTESTKQPATFSEGEFAGQANPADIRGSYTFGDISAAFSVSPAVLAQAFGVSEADPAAFPVKNLETIYADSPQEIGTGSVRLFVAFYTGLPFDLTTAETTYLPQSAAQILQELGTLPPERLAFLESHSLTTGENAPAPQPLSVTATPAATESATQVKGKTTFGELLAWGVPQTVIENLIGAPLPDPAMTVKDYAAAHGLDFETLRPALQAEVDK
ncbi:MAG: hypothetical protein Fur0035_15690 [Anaerolineales bacterium]